VKKKPRLQLLFLVILITAAAAIFILLRNKDNFSTRGGPAGISVNHPLPDFSLPLLDGKMTRLSDYSGKVVLVNIWATWCPPCLTEMPSMEKLYQQLKGKDFQILAVSIDASGNEAVGPFVKNHKVSFPVLIDPKGIITKIYRTTGVPESFIINKQGILVKKIIGPIDWIAPSVLTFFQELIQEPAT